MKISYQKVQNENAYVSAKCIYKFKIVSSVLKKHYKALARMAMLFNSNERNAGFIKKEDARKFLDLVSDIESSNNRRAANSHKKAAAKYKNKKSACDHADLGSLGYRHGERVRCPHCGNMAVVW